MCVCVWRRGEKGRVESTCGPGKGKALALIRDRKRQLRVHAVHYHPMLVLLPILKTRLELSHATLHLRAMT